MDFGYLASILTFQNEQEKRQVEHLQRLFALGAQMPWLAPLIEQAIKLPRNRWLDAILWWVHKLHKGFVINRSVHPARMSPKELWSTAKLFLGIRS